MSDITELFSRVAPADDADPDTAIVDADLARGRQALTRDHRRRTIRRSMAATTTLAAAVVVVVVAVQLPGASGNQHHTNAVTHTHHHTVTGHPKPHQSSATPQTRKAAPIKLVAYTGTQPPGFTVDKVPAGWFLGGVNQYALTIDPAGDKDVSADDFEGKLTVLLASKDETSFPSNGTHVTVDGQPGIIWDLGGVQLGYTDSAGHRIDIQVPSKLDWSDQQIVAFAAGVHVTSNALQGVG